MMDLGRALGNMINLFVDEECLEILDVMNGLEAHRQSPAVIASLVDLSPYKVRHRLRVMYNRGWLKATGYTKDRLYEITQIGKTIAMRDSYDG